MSLAKRNLLWQGEPGTTESEVKSMEVIVSEQITDEAEAERIKQLVSVATQHQSMVTPAGDECWEVIACIVPNEQSIGVLVQFALREVNDLMIRALVGRDENAEPLSVEDVIGHGQAQMPGSLYMMLAEQIVYVTEEQPSQFMSTAAH